MLSADPALAPHLHRIEAAASAATDYDHAYWFFNTTEGGPLYHAGYVLGFHLVEAYLNANPDHRPSDLAAAPAQRILADPAVLEVLTASRSPIAAPPGTGDAR